MKRVLEPEVMDTAEEADGYDAMDHTEANAAFVARLVDLGARGRMLDVGTGPGHIPLLVCERIATARVVGIDLAKHMLAHAERHRSASPHAAHRAASSAPQFGQNRAPSAVVAPQEGQLAIGAV